MKALEFFSGIGAFAYAAREFEIEVVQAWDQSADANLVYEHNFGLKPSAKNLDSLRSENIPDADLWWMSPPCKPYTVRGAQRDVEDPRAKSLLNLIGLIEQKLPKAIVVENVVAFTESAMCKQLIERLRAFGYGVQIEHLDSINFGTPMKRPRVFVVALQEPLPDGGKRLDFPSMDGAQFDDARVLDRSRVACRRQGHLALENYLNADNSNGRLNIPPDELARHCEAMHIIDIAQAADPQTYAICFTSGYDVSYRGSGSFLRYTNGIVRRFAPEEILALLGFGPDFSFPPNFPLRTAWRLAGNSVDVRCIRHLLSSLEGARAGVKNDHDSTADC